MKSYALILHHLTEWVSTNWGKFLDSWDKVSIDALFSAGMAILVFVLGWLISLLYEKKKESKRLTQRIRFLRGSLQSLLPIIDGQSANYKQLSEDLKENKSGIYSLEFKTNLNFTFFSSQLVEDSHRFLEQYESKSFEVIKVLSGAINGIETQREHAKHNHLSFSKSINRNGEHWVNAIGEVFRFNDRTRTIVEDSGEHEEFFNEFNEIISSWLVVRDDSNIEGTYDRLIAPLREYCLSILPNQQARNVLPYLHQSKYAYENIRSTHQIYSERFEGHGKQLDVFKTSIESVIAIIDENLQSFRSLRKFISRRKSKIHLLNAENVSEETTRTDS